MSHSKYRAKGQSYYLHTLNPRAAKYVVACRVCGYCGYDEKAASLQPYPNVVDELKHLYQPLKLDAAGVCASCSQAAEGRGGT